MRPFGSWRFSVQTHWRFDSPAKCAVKACSNCSKYSMNDEVMRAMQEATREVRSLKLIMVPLKLDRTGAVTGNRSQI